MTASRVSRRAAALFAVLALGGCATTMGPDAIRHGRATYNETINRTEDEQVLAMIVRHRYDESFGLLAVASVTASLRAGASVGANVGVGPASDYEGNLVPLSAGAAWEENPTISYVPVRGEQFVQRLLAPLGADETLLLARMGMEGSDPLRVLVRRANGLANPLYSSAATDPEFDRFVASYARLRERGVLDIARSEDGAFAMLLHDYGPDDVDAIDELTRLAGIRTEARSTREITLPLRFVVGTRGEGVDFETPTALEVVEAAGIGVDVPGEHLASNLARDIDRDALPFVAIRSSRQRPADASIAILHRDWWFYIDAGDARSKQGFLLLRTLIGLRLDDATTRQAVPVLTVPVSR
jgi:hypothetical protein